MAATTPDSTPLPTLGERVRALAWTALSEEIDAQGCALASALLSRAECEQWLRHGVSRLHSGLRHTLGIIFHDAK